MAEPDRRAAGDGGRRAFGELEGDVLGLLWAAGAPMTPSQIHAALGRDLAYTTVATVLTRLHDKGLVAREKAGRTHGYTATVGEADVATLGFRSVLTRSHDRRALLQGFVQSLSADDEDLLQTLLTRARRARAEPEGDQ
jgi:predicted transcriptional regulator